MRSPLDVRLYLVTGEVPEGRRLTDVVRAAVDGGVTLVQLRDKRVSAGELAEQYVELRDALAGSGVPLLLNDDVDTAAKVEADGVHVGPNDLAPGSVRARLGADAAVGWSIHRFDQLAQSETVTASDYLAASPVWSTPTKPDTTDPLGVGGVRALRDAMPREVPLVGIGGVNAGNARELIAAGADGVAVVSAICAADDPERAARTLRTTVDAALDSRAASAPGGVR